jgi:hypothetical protein
MARVKEPETSPMRARSHAVRLKMLADTTATTKKPRKPKSEQCHSRGAIACSRVPGCQSVVIKGKEQCRPVRKEQGQRQVCGKKKLDAMTAGELLAYAHRYYTQERGSGKPISRMNKGELCAFVKNEKNLNSKYRAKYDAQATKPAGKLPVDIAKGKYAN